jgi:hypothetical protein
MKNRIVLILISLLFLQLSLPAQTSKKTTSTKKTTTTSKKSTTTKATTTSKTTAAVPTQTETSSALKQALDLGVKRAVEILSKPNGFLSDNQVKIPFPEDIQRVDRTLRSVGLGNLADNFVKELNTGAEKAVSLATPILTRAITSMSFEDATKILLGGENSATQYFESKTKDSLYNAFKPKVEEVLDEYGISKSYSTLMSKYNSLPLSAKANTDINDYVTKETLKGLFIKVAQEENKIRTDAKARTTDLLKKVFGSITQQKSK